MTSQYQPGRYFADALEGRQDITDTYEILGDIPSLVGISSQNEDQFVASIRRLIEGESGGIGTIGSTAAARKLNARELYHSNRIAAVDGTDAVSALRFAADTIYAAGVILVTPQTQHRPKAHVARTRAAHLTPAENIGVTWTTAIKQWSEYLRNL